MNTNSLSLGAMYAVISLLACIAPKATFQLYGIVPVPAWLCVSGLFLYDAYSAMNNKVCSVDVLWCQLVLIRQTSIASRDRYRRHDVGGVLGGILYYLALRFRRF